jgi:hypothetical protein
MMQQTLSLANKDLIELDAGTEYMDDDSDSRECGVPCERLAAS